MAKDDITYLSPVDIEIRKKNKWTEGLNVAIITKEIVEWFDQKK